jgi:hypothetical protein
MLAATELTPFGRSSQDKASQGKSSLVQPFSEKNYLFFWKGMTVETALTIMLRVKLLAINDVTDAVRLVTDGVTG